MSVESKRCPFCDEEIRIKAIKCKHCYSVVVKAGDESPVLISGTDEEIVMCWCPPGEFIMGSPEDEHGRSPDEGPQHRVVFEQGFLMGKYPVTQHLWQQIMGDNPSEFTGDDRLPVELVSWDDCQKFLRKLNSKVSDGVFRLPSEAEWEYACRAGTTTPFCFGETLSTAQANYQGTSPHGTGKQGEYKGGTTVVGSFPANGWGLHDMHGNVSEWCQDWYHDSYDGAPSDGRAWEIPIEECRVLRGGCWRFSALNCRSAFRYGIYPDFSYIKFGFRLAMSP